MDEKNNQDNKEQVVNNELPKMESQVIGQLKTEKQKGTVGVIIIFIILIGFTFGLPLITDYVDKKANPDVIGSSKKNDTSEEQKVEEVEEPVYYEIDANSEFTVDNLKFSNLAKVNEGDYYLTFNLLNKANDTFNFKDNYYLELYNQDKTLLERVKLVNSEAIPSNSTIQVKLLMSENSFNNATILTVSTKNSADYKEVSLTTKDGEFDTLTCTNNGNNIVYYFKDLKLKKIVDTYEYSEADQQKYSDTLKEYSVKAAKYNNVKGVSSNIVDTNSSFVMNTQIELGEANINDLDSFYYYKKDTNPKIIKFEMESMRFTCK